MRIPFGTENGPIFDSHNRVDGRRRRSPGPSVWRAAIVMKKGKSTKNPEQKASFGPVASGLRNHFGISTHST